MKKQLITTLMALFTMGAGAQNMLPYQNPNLSAEELQRRRLLRRHQAGAGSVHQSQARLPCPAKAGNGDGLQLGRACRTLHGAVQ